MDSLLNSFEDKAHHIINLDKVFNRVFSGAVFTQILYKVLMQKFIPLSALSFFSLLCLMLGMSLFLLKSPEQKIDEYKKTAYDFIDQAENPLLMAAGSVYLFGEAEILLHQAALLNPYNPDWQKDLDMISERKEEIMGKVNTAFLPQKQLLP